MQKDYIISIDLGGTKILSAALNSRDGIVHRFKKSTKAKSPKADYGRLIMDSVNSLLMESGIDEKHIRAICLGIPGSVNPGTGVVGLAPNLGLKNYNAKEQLQKYTSIPVLIENDVNLAALGILNYGIAQGKRNVLVVFLGTGIGGGLVFNGELYRGSSFVAGEIGHMPFIDNGNLCGCGKRGCFEAHASRTAIVNAITAEIKKGKRSKLARYVKENKQIKSKALLEALEAGDPLTVKYVNQACEAVGKTIAGINNLLNLDLIVLGGGVIEAMHQHMMPQIKKAFNEHSLKDSKKPTKVLVSRLLDDAAIYGGLALAREFLDIKV